MSIVAPQLRIASAYVVVHGRYGEVSHYAQQRGVSRQWVYREAAWVQEVLTHAAAEHERLPAQVRPLQQRQAEWERLLSRAVVLDDDKQAAVATVGQARGVTLRDCQALLAVLIPGQVLSVATLGRRTQAAGARAGQLLAVLDEAARPPVREVAADEIYVPDPVLMVVEPESLCWLKWVAAQVRQIVVFPNYGAKPSSTPWPAVPAFASWAGEFAKRRFRGRNVSPNATA